MQYRFSYFICGYREEKEVGVIKRDGRSEKSSDNWKINVYDYVAEEMGA
jgi:hypothetical protein